jgi:tripartite-type tricarboxylate transporter receptor subunit TctC
MQSSIGICCVAAALFVAAMCAQPALAQEYPTRPLRLVTGAPGGANDFITRVIAQGLSAGLGQATVIENKPSGVMEGEAVVNAKPDGYTLLSVRWLVEPLPSDAYLIGPGRALAAAGDCRYFTISFPFMIGCNVQR